MMSRLGYIHSKMEFYASHEYHREAGQTLSVWIVYSIGVSGWLPHSLHEPG